MSAQQTGSRAARHLGMGRPDGVPDLIRWVDEVAALTTPVITALLASLAHLIDATRTELVAAYARTMLVPPGYRLAALAGHLHRAVPGIRLM